MADAEMSIVIDLTNDSYTLVDHYTLANVVIELDDSTSDSPLRNRRNEVQKKQSKKLMKVAREEIHLENGKENKKTRTKGASKLGDCPICFDELGQNLLASTKCGHVFCRQCLVQALRRTKRCPKCRRMLKCTDYHPLYI